MSICDKFRCQLIDYDTFFQVFGDNTEFHEFLCCLNNVPPHIFQKILPVFDVCRLKNVQFRGHTVINIVKATASDLHQFSAVSNTYIYIILETQQMFRCNVDDSKQAFLGAKSLLEFDM